MGSVRRRLAAATIFLWPSTAWAEVCEKVRPYWTPGSEATAWGEMIALMSTPPSLFLLITSAVCIRLRKQWATMLTVLLWSCWVYFVTAPSTDATRIQAIQEGCIGKPTLFILAVAAICVAMVLYTPRDGAQDT